MTWTLPRSVKLGFTAATLVLCTIGLISIWSTAQFMAAARARRVSYETRARLAGLFSHLQDAETGQRGYLLTGREPYLGPFTTGSQAVARDLEQLKRSEAPGSLPEFEFLDPLVEAKLAELSHTVALRRERGFAAALPTVATDWGRVLMDSIRSVIASMDSVESDRTARADSQVRATGRAALIVGAAGTLLAVGLVGVAIVRIGRDVAARNRAEEGLRRHAAELETTNAELDAFAYSVSHDLRTPLRGINGFSQALLEDYGGTLDETGRDYLQRVRAASERMAQLIDDLLNLSRVTRAELHRESVDVSALAQDIVDGLELSDSTRRVSCTIAAGLRVRADPHLLRVALENLIGNAWKYTSRRSDARIEVDAVQRDGQTAYYVRDNGVGFDMAHAANLFGAFQRLHADRDFEGTGIGLATVQRIVQRHGGRVWAESSLGQGASFYFTL